MDKDVQIIIETISAFRKDMEKFRTEADTALKEMGSNLIQEIHKMQEDIKEIKNDFFNYKKNNDEKIIELRNKVEKLEIKIEEIDNDKKNTKNKTSNFIIRLSVAIIAGIFLLIIGYFIKGT